MYGAGTQPHCPENNKKNLRNFKEHTKNPNSIAEIMLYIQLNFQHVVPLNLISLRPPVQRAQTHLVFPSLFSPMLLPMCAPTAAQTQALWCRGTWPQILQPKLCASGLL